MADDFERRTIIAPWCGAGIEEDPAVTATAGAPLLCSYMVSAGVFRFACTLAPSYYTVWSPYGIVRMYCSTVVHTWARFGGGDFLLHNEPSLARRCPTADGMFGSDLVAAELYIFNSKKKLRLAKSTAKLFRIPRLN